MLPVALAAMNGAPPPASSAAFLKYCVAKGGVSKAQFPRANANSACKDDAEGGIKPSASFNSASPSGRCLDRQSACPLTILLRALISTGRDGGGDSPSRSTDSLA